MEDSIRKEVFNSIKLQASKHADIHIKDLLDKKRLEEFQVHSKYLSFDYSKQRLTEETLSELILIPEKINLRKSILDLSNGEFVNSTEERTASHMLYRNLSQNSNSKEQKEISKQKAKLKLSLEKIGNLLPRPISTIISISIGGSRLGPEILSEAFGGSCSGLKVHYCSSVDLIELNSVLSSSDPMKTIIIISSKSFNTPEVIKNANRSKEWLETKLGDNCWDQIFGISCNKKAMYDFGIKDTNQFEILESLGGRYSIWSSISLSSILDMGQQAFEDFKAGAYEADLHFNNSPWEKNIPVLMALISCWNMNGNGINNLGIFTYNYRIRSLNKYLSQMGMESNGKTYTNNKDLSLYKTCPLIWGGYGPESQHSVFQWLLQGTDYSACDFIGIDVDDDSDANITSDSYSMLLAQAAALSLGEENQELKYKSVIGNNPISLLKLNGFSPKTFGFLLASYEHKVFVESQIYGINPFDQWGVQLGKKLIIESKKNKEFMKNYFDEKFLN